jgi:hypothetical protein
MALRLIRPCHEELESKGEMRGTHSMGLWGAGDVGKGRSVAVAASRCGGQGEGGEVALWRCGGG